MLSFDNFEDIEKMKRYYRTSDMINLLKYFSNISPVKDLTVILDEEDYFANNEIISNLNNIRVDSLKGSNVIQGIEVSGKKEEFLSVLQRVKAKDNNGVIILFNVSSASSERYAREAGIAVGVDVGECVYIDAVGKGFDGREISKSICNHERYYIPWVDLRKCCIENFKNYQTYVTDDINYQKSRLERVKFLESIGIDYEKFAKYIPEAYEPIPDYIWLSVIKGILKKLEKEEEFLVYDGLTHFAIHGHTEGKDFCPWQMFDKSRFELNRIRKK